MGLRRVLQAVVISTLILSLAGGPAQASAQSPAVPQEVRQFLAQMTPEERVAQLFLVTFSGTDTGEQSQIYDLVVNHHVGGVALLAGNDNFLAYPNTISGAHQLI